MAWEYKKKCFCPECRGYRRANDYIPTCDCVDCSMVRAEVCGNDGRVKSPCNGCGDSCSCDSCSAAKRPA